MCCTAHRMQRSASVCPPHDQPGGFLAQQQSRPSGKGGRGLQAQCDSQHRHSMGSGLLDCCSMLPQHHAPCCGTVRSLPAGGQQPQLVLGLCWLLPRHCLLPTADCCNCVCVPSADILAHQPGALPCLCAASCTAQSEPWGLQAAGSSSGSWSSSSSSKEQRWQQWAATE